MTNFFVYDSTTGEILRNGTCPIEMVYIQAGEPGEVFEIGTANEETEYFDLVNEVVALKTVSPVTIDETITTVVTQTDHDNNIWLQFPVGTILAVADGLYSMGFENISNPSKLYLNGEYLTEITDGVLEFALNFPSSPATIETFKQAEPANLGLHTLQIKSAAHLPFEVKVYAV